MKRRAQEMGVGAERGVFEIIWNYFFFLRRFFKFLNFSICSNFCIWISNSNWIWIRICRPVVVVALSLCRLVGLLLCCCFAAPRAAYVRDNVRICYDSIRFRYVPRSAATRRQRRQRDRLEHTHTHTHRKRDAATRRMQKKTATQQAKAAQLAATAAEEEEDALCLSWVGAEAELSALKTWAQQRLRRQLRCSGAMRGRVAAGSGRAQQPPKWPPTRTQAQPRKSVTHATHTHTHAGITIATAAAAHTLSVLVCSVWVPACTCVCVCVV